MRRLLAIAAVALAVAPTAAAKVPLHRCFLGGTNGLCGRVVVPENRARPEGRRISLRVMVLPATVKPRRDALFYVTGGPGGAATDSAAALAGAFAAFTFDRDVVLVDQRGTGGSHPLACAKAPVGVKNQAQADAYVRDCVAHVDGDARRYGTVDAMDDLDAVRRALGYGTIDLYGVSYGATAAQVFVNRHPDAVRAVVLDGGTLLGVPIFERLGSNGERALDQLARRCADDPACRKAFPTWRADLPKLVARLNRTPLRTKVAGKPVTLDGTGLESVIQSLTLSAEAAVQIPFAVSQAVRGRYVPLARLAADTGSPQSTAVMPYSVMCDEPWAVRDSARVRADAKGTYLVAAARMWALNQRAVCHAFPKRPERPQDWRPPSGMTPLLAIVGGADPQDPPSSIDGIRRTMPDSRVVVVPGQGHTVAQYGCMSDLIARFLARGTTRGLDVSCARTVPLPSFRYR